LGLERAEEEDATTKLAGLVVAKEAHHSKKRRGGSGDGVSGGATDGQKSGRDGFRVKPEKTRPGL
jgi:hypothetical protein